MHHISAYRKATYIDRIKRHQLGDAKCGLPLFPRHRASSEGDATGHGYRKFAVTPRPRVMAKGTAEITIIKPVQWQALLDRWSGAPATPPPASRLAGARPSTTQALRTLSFFPCHPTLGKMIGFDQGDAGRAADLGNDRGVIPRRQVG
jgi:hypothetical protein